MDDTPLSDKKLTTEQIIQLLRDSKKMDDDKKPSDKVYKDYYWFMKKIIEKYKG